MSSMDRSRARPPMRVALFGLALCCALLLLVSFPGGGSAMKRIQPQTWRGNNNNTQNKQHDSLPNKAKEVEEQRVNVKHKPALKGGKHSGGVASAAGAEPKAPLAVCNKTLTYTLANQHGLGSEVGLFIRAAAVARAYGYTGLFIDDSDWNFGRWTDYFEPIENDCLRPAIDPRPMGLEASDWKRLDRAPKYTKSDHIRWTHRDVFGLDATFNNLFVPKKDLERLLKSDKTKLEAQIEAEAASGKKKFHTVAGDDFVPSVFRKAYAAQRAELLRIWKPNEAVREMMSVLEVDLGLEEHTSKLAKQVTKARDVSIGVHCRLGDKFRELKNHLPPSTVSPPNKHQGLSPKLVNAFFDAAANNVDEILSRARPARAEDSFGSAWEGKPTMALMSDDEDAIEGFKANVKAKKWLVRSTQPKEKGATTTEDEEEVDAISGGFDETTFNTAPLDDRIAMARKFVADLTVLATATDGLVLTASSNVGRLMALLAGEEKAIKLGRIASLDTRWFPTAFFL